MDFSWPEEYLNYKKSVVNFAQKRLSDETLQRDQEQHFSRDLWKACADFGIQGLAVPKAYGGAMEEVAFTRAMLAMEGLGYGCSENGLPFGLNAQMWTVMTPILHFGNEAQKKKYLVPMAKGQMIGAHALTEPNAGSDIYSMELQVEKKADHYLLNGKKHLITLGPVCDVALVFANLNPKMGRWGISAFIVEKGTPGFTAGKKMDKLGMRSIPIGELYFEDCKLPLDCLLGSEGLGFSILNHSLEYDRCCILASQLGAMERQLEKAIAFAKQREQFGQPIAKFQSVSNRIVDMKLRLETSRLLLYRTAWRKEQGETATMDAALLKLQLSESFVSSSLDSMRIHGGKSYLSAQELDRDMRDAVGGILYAGTSDIQRNIVAKLLGL